MSLPKISHPQYDITIPIVNVKVKIRPMLVKEEKILLMAKQSDDKADQLNAIKQVVSNCVVSDIDCNNIPLYQLEYIFIKIRALSVSNKAKVAYRDYEDDQVYNFDVDLDKVQLVQSNQVDSTVMLSQTVSLTLKPPPTSLYVDKQFFDLSDDQVFEAVLSASIDKIFDGDKSYNFAEASKSEISEFINNIPAISYQQIQQYFNSLPTLNYEIKYTNTKGTERTITLSTLDDFFTF